MKNIFLGYYSPNDSQIAELVKNCIFILDTNVLLGLYRYPKSASDDLFKILTMVSDRLWIPYQVGLEYQENRLTVIIEQRKRFHDVKKIITENKDKLDADFGNLQLQERHSTINPDKFLQDIHKVFDKFLNDLNELECSQPDVRSHDPLRDKIDSLLEGKIGDSPENQDELEQIYQEGKKRYEQKQPPGYMDRDKDKELTKDGEKIAYRYNGLEFQRKYGDLILWKQIVKQAKNNDNFKNIIFITDDDKEDWWWKVKPANSRKEKRIGPRPELLSEIFHEANVKSFYMYSSTDFMKLAEKYLNATIKKESIEQVQDIITLLHSETPHGTAILRGIKAEESVFNWLKENNPNSLIEPNKYGHPDFIVILENGEKIGYEVKYFDTDSIPLFFRLRKTIEYISHHIPEKALDKIYIVVTTPNEEIANRLIAQTKNKKIQFPENINLHLLVGFISQEKKNNFQKLIFVSVFELFLKN